jgi:hypothetical protein
MSLAIWSAERVRAEVLARLLDRLRHATVDETPFSHFSLQHVFPDAVYAAMLEHLPVLECYRPDNPGKYRRVHRLPGFKQDAVNLLAGLFHVSSSRYTMGLDEARIGSLPRPAREIWQGIAGALASPDLKRAILDLFEPDLCRRFRTTRAGLERMPMFPRPGLVRDLTGYWIAPHPDTRAKIVTVQFYLARDLTQLELGTALYRRHLFNPRNLISLKNLFEKVKQLEFRPNSGYGFPVGRKSWHGREELPGTAGERNSLILFYYRDPSKGW